MNNAIAVSTAVKRAGVDSAGLPRTVETKPSGATRKKLLKMQATVIE